MQIFNFSAQPFLAVFQQVKERIFKINQTLRTLTFPPLGRVRVGIGVSLHRILHRLPKLLILPLDKRDDKTLHAKLILYAMQRTYMPHYRVHLPDAAEAKTHSSRSRVGRPT